LAAPGIGLVISLVAPAKHQEDAEDRPADLAGVDGGLHAPHRFVKAALADDAKPRFPPAARPSHGVAIGETGGQGFSTRA